MERSSFRAHRILRLSYLPKDFLWNFLGTICRQNSKPVPFDNSCQITFEYIHIHTPYMYFDMSDISFDIITYTYYNSVYYIYSIIVQVRVLYFFF